MHFEAFIFDMDGVLIDSEPLSMRALQAAGDAFGFTIPVDRLEAWPGLAAHMVFGEIAGMLNGGTSIDDFETLYNAIYGGWLPNVDPIPGAMELYALTRATGKPVGLATSSSRAWAEQVMANLALRFDTVVAQEDVTENKPAPEAYEKAAEGLGVLPEHCLVFEDSTSGVTAASRAGCTVWAYDGTFPQAQLREHGADRVFSDHFEMIRELEK